MKKQSHQRESGPVALLSKLFQGSFMFLHINTNYIHKSLSLQISIFRDIKPSFRAHLSADDDLLQTDPETIVQNYTQFLCGT